MSEPTPDPAKALPPVVAPSGRFIAQMFLVPGLIVAGSVALLLGFSWLAGGVKSRDKFLTDLASPNPDIRWRTASDLAQVLKRDADLAGDPEFGLKLADLLRQALGDMEKAEAAAGVSGLEGASAARQEKLDAQTRRAGVQYLAACVGNLATPVGGPVLADLARKPPARDPKTAALLRRQAVWALAWLGDNLQKSAALPDDRRAALLAEIDQLAERPEFGTWARQSADFLRRSAPFPAVAALLEASESDDPFLREQAAMALGFWDATPAENKRIDAALLRLARDDGHGTTIPVEVGDLSVRTTLAIALLLFAGCQKAAAPDAGVAAAASPSGRGWEVRYNAALAAARRGGDAAADPVVLDTLAEMLDESQQLRNFRTKLKDGREVADEQSAREAVIGTLRVVAELHRKRPALDLAPLKPAVAKLTESGNVVVRTEAKAAQLALDAK